MTRTEEMAKDIGKLLRYFQNDGIFSVDFDEEGGYLKAAMYRDSFSKKFNLWNTEDIGNQVRISRFVDGIEFSTYVPKDEYKEYIERIEF